MGLLLFVRSTNDELRRLRARSPLRIAGPVFHDPDTGLLFLDEE